jgi:hypothetical protein
VRPFIFSDSSPRADSDEPGGRELAALKAALKAAQAALEAARLQIESAEAALLRLELQRQGRQKS